nr:leukotriene B4 receptor 1-like [Nothobranchius furzeri]
MDLLNSTEGTSNFSSFSGLQTHPDGSSNVLVPVVVLSLCFITGVPGNIAAIVLRPNWQRMSGLSQSLLLNLAVSDLLGLLTIPMWIHALLYGWPSGLASCKVLVYFGYSSVYGSMLTVTGLSVQRYLMVVHQQKYQQVRPRLVLLLLWLVALILSIPNLVFQQLVPDQQRVDCRAQYASDAQWSAVLMSETVTLFASFSIVAFSYIRLKRMVTQATFFNNPQTSKLISSIVVSFFVLWTPYHVTAVLGVAAISLKNERMLKLYKYTWDIVAAVTFFNKCLNPFLYTFTSHHYLTFCHKRKPIQQKRRILQTPDDTPTVGL